MVILQKNAFTTKKTLLLQKKLFYYKKNAFTTKKTLLLQKKLFYYKKTQPI